MNKEALEIKLRLYLNQTNTKRVNSLEVEKRILHCKRVAEHCLAIVEGDSKLKHLKEEAYIVGILHDCCKYYRQEEHSIQGAQFLSDKGYSLEITKAIFEHSDKGTFSGNTLSGILKDADMLDWFYIERMRDKSIEAVEEGIFILNKYKFNTKVGLRRGKNILQSLEDLKLLKEAERIALIY